MSMYVSSEYEHILLYNIYDIKAKLAFKNLMHPHSAPQIRTKNRIGRDKVIAEKLKRGNIRKCKISQERKKTVRAYHLRYEGNPDSCVGLDELQ